MINTQKIFRFGLILLLLYLGIQITSAQNRKKDRIRIDLTVTDTGGAPVNEAYIHSSRDRYAYPVNEKGEISLSLRQDDKLKITAEGYKTKIITLTQAEEGKIQLEKAVAFTGESDVFPTLFGTTDKRRTVGSYSKVDGKDLESTPTMFFSDALGGRLNGLFIQNNTLVPGFTTANSFVRSSEGSLIIMIDGVERSMDYLEPETIESVSLLKDASLKSLYGGIQANGILMIKTKRGKTHENSVRVNVQSGIQKPTRLPKYLNSYDYTTLYNQAMQNSGYDPYFKNPELYKNGDPILYPDVDYYDMFLNDFMTITRANAQLSGGNENTRYFAHLGYQNNGGLEKFTSYPNRDEVFTIRANVDNTIFGFITFSAGFNAALQNKQWPNLSTQNFFNMLSDNLPNEFPIFIPGELAGQADKEFVLGGTAQNRNNPYGYLTQNGYGERDYTYVQTDFSLNIDLNKWVKGLSVKPMGTIDIYNVISSAQGATFKVFEPIASGENVIFNSWGKETRATSKSRTGNSTNRNYAFNVTAAYNRDFGKHSINALVTYFQQSKEYTGLNQKLRRMNLGGLINYMYANKYIGEVSVNRVGVGSFAPSKRFGVFPTFGAGWIISEENFMKQIKWLDYLKIRGSYGILGSTSYTNDGLFSSYLYKDVWTASGTYDVNGFNKIATMTQTGNPKLGFQKSHETNVGIDAQFLKRSLWLSVGYFNNKLNGVLANLTDLTPGVAGKPEALMTHNYKTYRTYGWEGEISWQQRFGDWKLQIGANLCYGKTDIEKDADPAFPAGFEGLQKVKTVGDVLGLTSIGTFEDEADISASPAQHFGAVTPKDIKYKDMNGDQVIDNKDRRVVANTTPHIQYGINIHLEFKGINLDLLGYGLGDFDRVLDSKYYQIYGNRKYSAVLTDGLPNGRPHPVLKAEYSNNNFQSSDYWVVNGSFFKLRNAELGYTFPHAISKKIGLNTLKIFARGTNLFTISKIKDLDPESLEAGVGNFPLGTTLTGGLSIAF